MSDAPQGPDSAPTRDAVTGRYVRRPGAPDDATAEPSADAPTPAEAASASADTPATPSAADAPPPATPSAADAPPPATQSGGDAPPPATQSGGDAPPPATPPPAGPADEDKDGKKRWMLLLLLLLILLALLCAGFSYMTWWRKDGPKDAQPTPTAVATTGNNRPSSPPSATSSPNASPSPSPSTTARMLNMPNVVGMPAADAKVILEGAGFTNIKFVTEANPDTDLPILVSYTVIKQSVAAGTQVPPDTAIVVTCRTTSNGKG